MTFHTKRKATQLSPQEVKTILEYWEVSDWNSLSFDAFQQKFNKSEFHLLTNESSMILSIARINFDFKIIIQNQIYEFAEFVGFVSTEKMRGYGKKLITYVRESLKERNIETIGFCEKQLRPFYEKCNIDILYDKAKQLREKTVNG